MARSDAMARALPASTSRREPCMTGPETGTMRLRAYWDG
jgi:hypothetical protein